VENTTREMLETDCTPETIETRSVHRIYRVDVLSDKRIARAVVGLVYFLGTIVPLFGAEWVQINSNQNLTVYAKDRPGSSIKELRAVGLVDAPSSVILNVLDEVADYPDFMPYTTKAQLIERRAHGAVIYFRWDPPLIGARDVTVALTKSSTQRGDGKTSYQLRWEPISTAGPAPSPGVIRITLDEGSWKLEPTEDGKKTTVIYDLFTDGGGGLPAFVINLANRQSVNDLFQAIRKQVTLPKYSQRNPVE
jgi:Polyketide cyclase / dehydrase and lipid transport